MAATAVNVIKEGAALKADAALVFTAPLSGAQIAPAGGKRVNLAVQKERSLVSAASHLTSIQHIGTLSRFSSFSAAAGRPN